MKFYRLFLYILIGFLSSHSYAADKQTQILAVVEEKAGRVDFYDTKTHHRLGGTAVGSLPHEIAIANDKNLAFISNFGLHDYDLNQGTPGNSISVVDLNTYKEIYKLSTGDNNAPHGVKLRPKHPDELYVNTEVDNQILVFDLKTNQVKRRFPAIPGTHNFIFSPDGEWLWLMAGKNGVSKLDAETGALLGQFQSDSPIRGLNYTNDNQFLMLSGKDQVVFLNPLSIQVDHKIDHLNADQLLYSAMTPDGKYILAPAVWNNEVIVIDSQTQKIVKRIVTGLDPVNIIFSQDSHDAYVSNGRSSHVVKINLQTLTQSEITTQPGSNGIALFSRSISSDNYQNTEKELSIGTLLPLSGPQWQTGRNLMLGYEFIKEHINQQGGIKLGDCYYHLSIHYIDTESNTSKLPELIHSLQNEYHIKALLDYYQQNTYNKTKINDLAIIPFFSKLSQYEQIDNFLFGDFKNLDAVKKAFSTDEDLELTEDGLRSYLTLSFLDHTLTKNMYLSDLKNNPGILLLHTSSGVREWDYDWAKLLNDHGYRVFILDSFSPRGYADRKSIGWDKAYQAQLDDLQYGYQLLVSIAGADKNRIGIIGYSLGGYSALRAMETDSPSNTIPFKLAAAFYGHAQRFKQSNFKGKIALFWGDDDDRAPLAGAIDLVKNANQSDIQLFHYPHAKHGFDNTYLPGSIELTDENGQIYHLGYNAEARERSIQDMLKFMNQL